MTTTKKIIAFCYQLRFEGILDEEDEEFYYILDKKSGKIKLPKNITVLNEVQE